MIKTIMCKPVNEEDLCILKSRNRHPDMDITTLLYCGQLVVWLPYDIVSWKERRQHFLRVELRKPSDLRDACRTLFPH